MSEAEARKAVETFYIAFNARDAEALGKICHYPHVMIANTRIFIVEDFSRYINFENKIVKKSLEREGWHHSKLLSLEAIHVSDDKIHFKIEFGRYKENGAKYAHYKGIWILIRENNHWGILARSIYTP